MCKKVPNKFSYRKSADARKVKEEFHQKNCTGKISMTKA